MRHLNGQWRLSIRGCLLCLSGSRFSRDEHRRMFSGIGHVSSDTPTPPGHFALMYQRARCGRRGDGSG